MIYWPEETTWDDNAASSVRRNRITFMRYLYARRTVPSHEADLPYVACRYLTKIADQVVCLLSDDHAQAIVWRNEVEPEDEDMDDDDDDRLFTFEVSKTNEQEEGITSRPGFTVRGSTGCGFVRLILMLSQLTSAYFSARVPPADSDIDPMLLRPRVAAGETQQGLLTAEYVPAQERRQTMSESYSTYRLKNTL